MPMFRKQSLSVLVAAALTLSAAPALPASGTDLTATLAERAQAIESKLIDWRRDIHAHPELGNQETRTAGLVAEHLRSLGLEVRTGVARTVSAARR